MFEEDDTAPDAPVVDTPAAAEPEGAPAEAAEPEAPAAEAAPPAPPAPAFPKPDDFDFSLYDYDTMNVDVFPEGLRPWLKPLVTGYSQRHANLKGDLDYYQQGYESLLGSAEETPALEKMRQENLRFQNEIAEANKVIENLRAESEAQFNREVEYRQAQADRVLEAFLSKNGEAVKAADPEVQQAFAEAADLDDPKNPDLVYLEDFDAAWEIAKAGQLEELKNLAAAGLPSSLAVEFLAMKRGASSKAPEAPSRPKAADTADIMAGADGVGSVASEFAPDAGDVEDDLSSIPANLRSAVSAVRKAQRRHRK